MDSQVSSGMGLLLVVRDARFKWVAVLCVLVFNVCLAFAIIRIIQSNVIYILPRLNK